MKAWILQHSGKPYELSLEECPAPEPQAGEVRLRVNAISLNPVDYKVAQGAFALETPRVIGIDAAGEVDALGEGVTAFSPGERVFAMLDIFQYGSFAEYTLVDASALSRIPADVTFQQASTLPCAGMTAWQAVVDKLNVRAGQRVFISAGGGGVGGFAIQLAKQRGAEVFTSASRNFERLQALGADHVIDYTKGPVVERLLDMTEQKGVHAVIDMLSGQSSMDLAAALRHNGGLVSIAGRPKDNPVAPFSKAISLHEVAIVAAYSHGDADNLREIALAGEQMAAMIADNTLDPMLSEELPFSEIPQGLQALATGHTKGKIVVTVE